MPDVVGKTQAEAETILRKAKLTIGQVSPQPPDPKAKISSQIPAAKEVVKEGKPIAIFTADPRGKKKGKGKVDKKNGGRRRRRRQGRGGGAARAGRRCRSPRPRRRPPRPASCPRRSTSSPARRRAR